MVDNYLLTKFGIGLMVSEKTRFTDGRTTTDDECPRHGISSADTVKQS